VLFGCPGRASDLRWASQEISGCCAAKAAKLKDRKLDASQFAGFQRARAYVYALWFAVNENPNFLNVNAPSAAVFVVGV